MQQTLHIRGCIHTNSFMVLAVVYVMLYNIARAITGTSQGHAESNSRLHQTLGSWVRLLERAASHARENPRRQREDQWNLWASWSCHPWGKAERRIGQTCLGKIDIGVPVGDMCARRVAPGG